MRKTIARRLLASHQDIPTFFLTASFDVHGLVELREALKKLEIKVSYNDLLVMCVARALREFPRANASWRDTDIVRHGRVDVGIAVAMPDGLVTPVLRGADALSVTEISERTKDLAARGRAGKLAQEEYTGATFTISNLGMFDISHFTAIINPPEAAILAVGSVAQVPVVHSGALAVGWRTNVTMTCDHRVIDGATGAEFLQVLRRYVECPALLGVL
jgi:pyruvate dehydrogenase E2 component (dihydrolipoamide acetyltransferase)